ncbi:hypothetical protein DENSPDRAFT_832011 [Dentipellis sp. KUC8613]|nr:hypothetical protein DENSPDRAFT_832011 [Dentipellis sp. KUC8613]
MPIVDPSLGVVLPEKKPRRRCFWRNCPRDRASAATTKACARCKLVRYCSSSCQKADWKKHKEVCREPQNVDIGAWISVHEPELRWAAAQALGGYSGSGPNRTSSHALKFTLRCADRSSADSSENPFIMLDVNVVPLEIILGESAHRTLAASDLGGHSNYVSHRRALAKRSTTFDIRLQGECADQTQRWSGDRVHLVRNLWHAARRRLAYLSAIQARQACICQSRIRVQLEVDREEPGEQRVL